MTSLKLRRSSDDDDKNDDGNDDADYDFHLHVFPKLLFLDSVC